MADETQPAGILCRAVHADTNARVTLVLSAEDAAKLRPSRAPTPAYRGIIADRATGTRYRAFVGEPCGMPNCSCHIIVVELSSGGLAGR